jgi:hypothetical protein
MRWRAALALAASVAGAALLSGVGPAWADQPAAPVVRRADAVALSVVSRPVTPPDGERAGPLVADRPDAPGAEVRTGRTPPPAGPEPAAWSVVDAVVRVAGGDAARGAVGRPVAPPRDTVLPTGTAIVPSTGPSVPGTGGGDGDSDPRATGMAVGSVLLIGVGLIAAGVALVGLRNRRDTADHSHYH